jgi:putative Ig domain-containing protein
LATPLVAGSRKRLQFSEERNPSLCSRWGLVLPVLVLFCVNGCNPTESQDDTQVLACKRIAKTQLTLAPAQTPAGSSGVTITITDTSLSKSGFAKISRVLWNGSQNGVSTRQPDAFTLTAEISPSLLATPGTAQITVGQACKSSSLDNFSKPADFVISAAPLQIITTALPAANLNSPYPATTILAAGGIPPYQFHASGLPPGLQLSVDGQLSGIPTTIEGSPFAVSLQVTDSGATPQTASKVLNLTVTVAPLAITTTSLPSGFINTSYSATLTATGGTRPYAWSIPLNQLPTGLVLNPSTGVISGTPTSLLSTNLQVSVVDSSNPSQTNSRTLGLSISPVGPFISSLMPTTANVGGAPFVLFVTGLNFQPSAELLWNTAPKPTHVNDSGNLFANIDASDLAAPGNANITVVNTSDPSHPSNTVTFPISADPNPVPEILSLLPASAQAGSPDLTFHVAGNSFVGNSVIEWNGTALQPTTVIDTNLLLAVIPAQDLVSVGVAQVRVVNPPSPLAGGGGTSAASLPFRITSTQSIGVVDVISQSSTGTEANLPARNLSLSNDGRYAAFDSAATNLLSQPLANANENVYVHDSCRGVIGTCSEATAPAFVVNFNQTTGTAGGGGHNSNISISGDGRFVADWVSNRDSFDGSYVVDMCPGGVSPCPPIALTRVSLTNSGQQPSNAPGPEVNAMSRNGEFVAFTSPGTDLVSDTNIPDEVYIRDTCVTPAGAVQNCATTTQLVSRGDGLTGVPDNSPIPSPTIAVSATGRLVAFISTMTPSNGNGQVFVRDTCLHISGCSPTTTLVSVDGSGNPASFGVRGRISLSDDGRFVLFQSTDRMAPNSSGFVNLFLRDTCRTESGPVQDSNCPRTDTISVASDGTPQNGDSSFGQQAVSSNGRFVVFNSSATNLLAGQATPARGVYVRDTCFGRDPTTCSPTTKLVSVDATGAFLPAVDASATISPDGHYCAFIVAGDSGTMAGQAVLALTGF